MRDGQVPAVPDRHEAKAEAQNPAGQRGNAIGETEQIADDDNACADQGCDGVEIGTQNMRNISEENVARHPAADTGQHAEEARHGPDQPEYHRFLSTGDRSERASVGTGSVSQGSSRRSTEQYNK